METVVETVISKEMIYRDQLLMNAMLGTIPPAIFVN
jgi:hypothetical protein